jgi:hypothetical protein
MTATITDAAPLLGALYEIQERIDAALKTYTGRNLIDADEVVDLLLDLRQIGERVN